jgi:hypothetical protein
MKTEEGERDYTERIVVEGVEILRYTETCNGTIEDHAESAATSKALPTGCIRCGRISRLHPFCPRCIARDLKVADAMAGAVKQGGAGSEAGVQRSGTEIECKFLLGRLEDAMEDTMKVSVHEDGSVEFTWPKNADYRFVVHGNLTTDWAEAFRAFSHECRIAADCHRQPVRWRVYNLAFRLLGRTRAWPWLGNKLW